MSRGQGRVKVGVEVESGVGWDRTERGPVAVGVSIIHVACLKMSMLHVAVAYFFHVTRYIMTTTSDLLVTSTSSRI